MHIAKLYTPMIPGSVTKSQQDILSVWLVVAKRKIKGCLLSKKTLPICVEITDADYLHNQWLAKRIFVIKGE